MGDVPAIRDGGHVRFVSGVNAFDPQHGVASNFIVLYCCSKALGALSVLHSLAEPSALSGSCL